DLALDVLNGVVGLVGAVRCAHRCALSFTARTSSLVLATASWGTGGTAFCTCALPISAMTAATTSSTAATISAAAQAGITSARPRTAAATSTAAANQPTTPAPPR